MVEAVIETGLWEAQFNLLKILPSFASAALIGGWCFTTDGCRGSRMKRNAMSTTQLRADSIMPSMYSKTSMMDVVCLKPSLSRVMVVCVLTGSVHREWRWNKDNIDGVGDEIGLRTEGVWTMAVVIMLKKLESEPS